MRGFHLIYSVIESLFSYCSMDATPYLRIFLFQFNNILVLIYFSVNSFSIIYCNLVLILLLQNFLKYHFQLKFYLLSLLLQLIFLYILWIISLLQNTY